MKWYYKLSDLNKYQLKLGEIIIRRETTTNNSTNHKFTICNIDELKHLINNPITRSDINVVYHEIYREEFKVFFDLDGFDPRYEQRLIECVEYAMKQIVEPDMMYYLAMSSSNNVKGSLHIVFPKISTTPKLMKKIYLPKIQANMDPSAYKCIDQQVYRNNGSLRCLDTVKIDGRCKRLINRNRDLDTFYHSLVSMTSRCIFIGSENDIQIQHYKTDCKLSNEQIKLIENKVYELYKGNVVISEIKNSLISLRCNKSYYCAVCAREHEHENPYITISKNGDVLLRCRRYDENIPLKLMKLDVKVINKKELKKGSLEEVNQRIDRLRKKIDRLRYK